MINAKYIVYILSPISFFFCLFQDRRLNYEYLFLLPLSLGILSVLFSHIYKLLNNSIVFNIFLLQLIIRYCVIPFVFVLGNFYVGANSLNGNTAIFIMILEIIFAFAALNLVALKQRNSYLSKINTIIPMKNSIFLYGLILVMLMYIYQNGYLERVNFIWNLDNYIQQYIAGNEELQDSKFAGLLFIPFKVIVSLFIISRITVNKKISYRKKYIYYFITFIASSIFIIGTSRLSMLFFSLPILVLISLIIPPKISKKILVIFTFCLIPIIIIASINKFTKENSQISLSDIFNAASLNAYFSGPGNVAVGLDAYEQLNTKENILFCINDIFQNAPGLAKYTSAAHKTNRLFNKEIYGNIEVADQIVPLSISGIFHFDIFGAFFYVTFFLLIALYMERKSHKEKFIAYKYMYISLSITLSMTFILNIGSMFLSLFSTYLFLYLPVYVIYQLQSMKSYSQNTQVR